MLKWTVLLILLLMVFPVVAIKECTNLITTKDIPCLIISSWEYESCNNTQVKIYNSTPSLLDTRNFTDFGLSGRCNFTWNYTMKDSYFWNVTNGDSGRLIIDYEVDDMAGFSIIFFMMVLTGGIFLLGMKTKFTSSELANYMIRKSIYLGGIWMLVLTIVVALNVSANFGVGVNDIMYRLLWFAHKGALIFTIAMMFGIIINGLKMWKVEKNERRMGNYG